VFTEPEASARGAARGLRLSRPRQSIRDRAPGRSTGVGDLGNPNSSMKKFGVFVAVVLLLWFLLRIRGWAVKPAAVRQAPEAIETPKGMDAVAEMKALDKMAVAAPVKGKTADDAIDRSPFHFLSTTPAGKYAKVSGPLTFHAKEPIRLVLEMSPEQVSEDMPDLFAKPGDTPKPDQRIANTTFEVTTDKDGTAEPVPYRAYGSPAPEPSDVIVVLELGAKHGAPNARGSYQIRAIYRQGKMTTAPITVIVAD
jgi:hypothetical protein